MHPAETGHNGTLLRDGRLLVNEGRLAVADMSAVTKAGAETIHKIWDEQEARVAFVSADA